MIITKTPFRMSFFGGGTDMENYFKENGGAVLSTTFDKYCYVNVRHLPRFFDYSTEISYSKTERVTNVDDIQHPAVRNAMKMLDMHEIRLTYEADLPARSGLGTSSSFAVGMLNAFYALKGKYADKKKLADEAIFLERTLCSESGGDRLPLGGGEVAVIVDSGAVSVLQHRQADLVCALRFICTQEDIRRAESGHRLVVIKIDLLKDLVHACGAARDDEKALGNLDRHIEVVEFICIIQRGD